MILILAIAAILFALMFPDTETGRFAKRHFVAAPARWLNGLSPLKMAAVVAGFLFVVALSVAFPPDLIIFAAGDLTAYFEVIAGVVLAATQVRYRRIASAVTNLRGIVMRPLRRPARRALRVMKTAVTRLRPSDDDDPSWRYA